MPTSTYVALATTTLASAASSVTFGSLPSYRDYIVVINWTNSSSTGSNVGLRFNADSGSNYPHIAMYNDGTSTPNFTSGTQSFAYVFYGATTSEQMATCQIMDGSATDKHTTVLSRSGGGSYRAYAWVSRWANTSALTSIEVVNTSVNFTAGSTISLFGIEA